MFDFLNYNSPFVQWLYRIANMIFLSILWIIFCIPVFTAGASTAALYYSVQKNVKNDRDTAWACFWQSFRQNFKQSVPITLIFIAIAFVLLADIAVIDTLREYGRVQGYAKIFFIAVLVVVCVYAFWVFSYLARFQNTVRETMKYALMLAVTHFPTTLLVALIGAGSILLIWLMPVTIFIMPATSVLSMSFLTEKVFRLHMTDADKQLEDELNMEWHDDYGERAEKKKADGGSKRKWRKRR